MSIKLIIFDLDGVLVDSRDMHYESLNRALMEIAPTYVISREDHLSTYDGLPTLKKLDLLSKKGLDRNLHKLIWEKKQYYTNQIIVEEYTYDERIRSILRELKNRGYLLYVASNSIYETLKNILLKKGFMEYIDYFISHDSIKLPKPNPEIYFRSMVKAGVSCQETIIVEDSAIGRTAAIGSGANLLAVENSSDVTLQLILSFIESTNANNQKRLIKWKGKLNVVITMAGLGTRFSQVGYNVAKPFIDVFGKPMIQVVVENLNFDPLNTRFIFIIREEHIKEYNAKYLLNLIAPGCIIISVTTTTLGPAASCLLAKDYINNDEHLFIANSDQYVEWDANDFMYSMINPDIDGGIVTFSASSNKWSYVTINSDGYVTEVAEKRRISEHATVGFYYWKRGSDYVKYCQQMMDKDIRTNNEFYTCPVYNEAILDNKKIKIYPVIMHGLGEPKDLEFFLQSYPVSSL